MKSLLFILFLLCGISFAFSQEEISTEQKLSSLEFDFKKAGRLNISGCVQVQWQLAEQPGIDGFVDGGSFNSTTNNRFQVRRGRIKFTYTYGIVQLVIQPDFTEKGVSLKDAYVTITAPSKVIAGQAGLFDVPFGYEVGYSSSVRESPERSRVFSSLFPGSRDLGVMLTLRGKSGILSDFSLNLAGMCGNGIGVETDSRKNVIARLSYLKKFDNAQVGAAFSYYNGGMLNNQDTNYKFVQNEGYEAQEVVKKSYSLRQYFGFSAQYIQQWAAGNTHIRGEYVWGEQPGIAGSNRIPGGTSFAINSPNSPLFLRSFQGAYIMLTQDIGKSRHSVVLKYDYYDPNKQIKGNEIGRLSGTGAADIAYNTYGIGYLFRWNQNIRLMAYYDFIQNETSENLSNSDPLKNFSQHVKQNVLTLRVQVKF